MDITLKKDAIEFTIHFKVHPLETLFILDKVNDKVDEFCIEYEEEYNVAVDNIRTQSELPLFVIILDTNNPAMERYTEYKMNTQSVVVFWHSFWKDSIKIDLR